MCYRTRYVTDHWVQSCRIRTSTRHSDYAHKDIQWLLTRECKRTREGGAGTDLAGVAPGETGDDAAPRGRGHAGAITPAVHAAGEAAASRRQAGARTGAASGRGGWSGHGHGDRARSRHGCDATADWRTGEAAGWETGSTARDVIQIRIGPMGRHPLISRPNIIRPIAKWVDG